MTDLPRRAYPLVVAAPGGFEDAVRRGRGIRRRRAGGSTGAALALAGVIAYSVMQADDLNPKGLHPTRDLPGIEQPATLPGILVEPTAPDDAPTSAPAVSGPVERGGGPVGGGPVGGPTARPTTGPIANVPGRPSPTARPRPGRAYAPRGDINESKTPMTTEPEAECLQDQTQLWCGRALATEVAGTPGWDLQYTLCRRSIDAAAPGVIEFDREQEAEFSVVDTATGETIWTYSAGQRVVSASETTQVAGGECAHWTTRWNGYDDFGLTPQPGGYQLVASSTGRSDTVLPTKSDDFTHGDASV